MSFKPFLIFLVRTATAEGNALGYLGVQYFALITLCLVVILWGVMFILCFVIYLKGIRRKVSGFLDIV